MKFFFKSILCFCSIFRTPEPPPLSTMDGVGGGQKKKCKKKKKKRVSQRFLKVSFLSICSRWVLSIRVHVQYEGGVCTNSFTVRETWPLRHSSHFSFSLFFCSFQVIPLSILFVLPFFFLYIAEGDQARPPLTLRSGKVIRYIFHIFCC